MKTRTEAVSSVIVVLGYLRVTLFDNFFMKFIVGTAFFALGAIYRDHEVLLRLMVFLFVADAVLGVICAMKNREVESRKLFGGALKLGVYGLLLIIAFAMDQALHVGHGFISGMFAYILLRDATSILENLEILGYKTPLGLRKYLKYRAENVFKLPDHNSLNDSK